MVQSVRRAMMAKLVVVMLVVACGGSVDPTGPGAGPGTGGSPGTGGGPVTGGGPGTGGNPGTQVPGSQFVGVYRVSSVNGNPLSVPYVVEDIPGGSTGRQYLEAGSLVLEDDGTFHLLLEKAATINNGPRIRATQTRTGTWEYTPAQSGDMSGPVVLHMSQGELTVDATPYTVTMQYQLDLLNGGTALMVLVKD